MPDGLPFHVDDVPTHRWEAGEIGATRRRLGRHAGLFAGALGIKLLEEEDRGRR